MCYERWMRRERRREERFDKEIRLLDEERTMPEPPQPVVEEERTQEPRDPERVHVEAGGRA